MKKYILSAASLLAFSVLGFGQLSLQDTSGATIPNGDTIVVNGVVGFQMSADMYIYDNSLAIKSEVLSLPTPDTTTGCTYSVCVGTTCYPPKYIGNSYLTPSFTAPSGKDPNVFAADYNPTYAGTSIVRFDLRNTLHTDSAWVYVKYVATPVGIPVIADNTLSASSFYPNPANSNARFTYHTDIDAKLNIYNSLGQLVNALPVSASKGSMDIDVAGMPSGIYICKLQSSTGVAFRKLIVSH